MIAENIIRIVVGVTISIYVVRFLGPNDYGIYVYALSLTGILAPLATLGIDSILLRDVILNKEVSADPRETDISSGISSYISRSFESFKIFFNPKDCAILTVIKFLEYSMPFLSVLGP